VLREERDHDERLGYSDRQLVKNMNGALGRLK